MRIRLVSGLSLAGLMAFCCLGAPAQDAKEKLPSNVVPSAFRAFLVTDGRFPPVKTPDGMEKPDPRNRAGKLHCLVCENGLAPVIAVFVRLHGDATALDAKGLEDLLKKTNALIPKYRSDKLASFVMFLRLKDGTKVVTVKSTKDKMEVETKVEQDLEYPDEDDDSREKYSEDLKAYSAKLNVPNIPFGLAAEKSKAVTEWLKKDKEGKEDDNDLTVVVYYRMRIVGEPWKFKNVMDLNEQKVDAILKSAEDAIAGRK